MKNGITRTKLARTSTPIKIGLIALTLAGSQIAAAAETGWYVGGNFGQANADTDNNGIVASRLAQGFTTNRLTKHDSDNAFKIFTGYQLSDYVALEGGYFDLGEFSYKAFQNRPYGVFTADTKVRGFNFDLVGFLPMGERLSAFARIGVARYETKDSFRGYGNARVAPFGDEDDDMSPKMGVGLQYDFTPNVAMRLEAERYDIKHAMFRDRDVDMYSLGVVYRFGAPVAAAEPARTPVSAAPPRPAAPAPAPAAPATPEPVRVTVSADALFGFDSAALTPAGRTELQQVATDLRGVDYDTIIVIGHTDRMGSQSYNQDLSTRRAVAVRNYLVESGNIPQAKINTRGVGSSQPVTTMAQCGNQLARSELIACLAPDRRVEVEVTGSRPR